MDDDPRANPLAGNPLATRADLQRAVKDLVAPILPHFSPGGARVRLGSFGAAFPHRDAELEGFARPLFGLAPLVAGGGRFDHWDPWVRGLATGSDPDHPEHWSMYESMSQAMVEQAAIGLALAMVPEVLWEPQDPESRGRLARWLGRINRYDPAPNNWQFFRVLVNLGLERVGEPTDEKAVEASLSLIESYALDEGWYQDGALRARDHYIAWAMHVYGLVYAWARPEDPRSDLFRERAALFARDFDAWFDADGATLPFGRSLTYRFAAASFWSALVLADIEALPWGQVKGHLLRHLRWWSRRPISDRDGVLSIGWCYTNPWMREEYNSAGSPYWAMKAFLCLAAPEDHPFWEAEEESLAADDEPRALSQAGMVIVRDPCQAVAVSGGHDSPSLFNQMHAKYGRLAYSTRFPFCLDLRNGLPDSSLRLEDVESSKVMLRQRIDHHEVRAFGVYSRWTPVEGIAVHTVLGAGAPWHLRIHRIETDRRLAVLETGFAVGLSEAGAYQAPDTAESSATAVSAMGATTLIDLAGARTAGLFPQPPNASLAAPFSMVPRLDGILEVGVHDLMTAVGVSVDPTAVDPSEAPRDVARLLDWLDEATR